MWRDAGYVDALESFRQCLLLDHRGHGRSDQPPLAESHTMAAYAADVAALLDHVEVERAAFWGYSQGGEIGLAVAALHRERLSALITTGVITNPDRKADAAETAETIKDLRARGWDALVDPTEPASLPAWFQRQVEKTNVEMLVRWLEAYGDWDPWVRLATLTTPILMFVGELEDPDGCEHACRKARAGRACGSPGRRRPHRGVFAIGARPSSRDRVPSVDSRLNNRINEYSTAAVNDVDG
jgi:pimeloyl-ACP methyl ester carboxylesterase